jgi:dTDP-glucose pyrophosphorylase
MQKVIDIIEKANISYGYRGTGIYIFEPQIFDYCAVMKESERGELELQDVIKKIILDGEKVLAVLLKGVRIEITTASDIYEENINIKSRGIKK